MSHAVSPGRFLLVVTRGQALGRRWRWWRWWWRRQTILWENWVSRRKGSQLQTAILELHYVIIFSLRRRMKN